MSSLGGKGEEKKEKKKRKGKGKGKGGRKRVTLAWQGAENDFLFRF